MIIKWVATDWRIRGLKPSRGKIFSSSPERPNWLSDTPSLLFNSYRGSLLGVKWPEREVIQSHPFSAEDKYEWIYNIAFPICLLDVEGKILPFYYNSNNNNNIESCSCSHITHLLRSSTVGFAYPAAIPPSARNWRSQETVRVEPVVLKARLYQRTRDPVISLSGIFSHFMIANWFQVHFTFRRDLGSFEGTCEHAKKKKQILKYRKFAGCSIRRSKTIFLFSNSVKWNFFLLQYISWRT
jgi:hypothetical protein